MPAIASEVGTVAAEYCRNMPEMSTLGLARLLAETRRDLFKNVEHARSIIRYYRQERGPADALKAMKAGSAIPTTKWQAPDSDAPPFAPYRLAVQGCGLVMGDLHIPYHDRDALETAVEYARRRNATDYLLILGDLMDCYQASRFSRDPRMRSIPAEIEMTQDFLSDMAGIFGTVIVKAGNHEQRLQDYLFRSATALVGLPSLEMPALLGIEDIGAEYVSWDDPIYVGDHLTLLHGHEYGRSMFSPVNAARGLFMRSLACSVTAHYHRTSHHDETDIRGRNISTWSIGCLCDLHPQYMRMNKWNHGFALLEVAGTDDWNVSNHRIVCGHVR